MQTFYLFIITFKIEVFMADNVSEKEKNTLNMESEGGQTTKTVI